MNILVVNSGSSSFKYQLFDMTNETVVAKGLADRIGLSGGTLRHSAGGPTVTLQRDMATVDDAIALMLAQLTGQGGAVRSLADIAAVGHRVGHGGDYFDRSVAIDDDGMAKIKELTPLVPLHQPAFLKGIEACSAALRHAPQVAAFDSAFHQTMSPVAYTYGLPDKMCRRLRIRRYGFHGSSHRFVSERAAVLLGREDARIVTCHLGSGGSVAAIHHGRSVDTSMGLTPLEGLVMGTRCGDLDPAVIEYLMAAEGKSIGEIMAVLQKQSGLLGLSGISPDMRDVLAAANAGDERARLALEVYCYRVRKYIGAYAAVLEGLDAVVFTAGVGENSARVRELCVQGLQFMGVSLDVQRNQSADGETDISSSHAPVRTLVIPTNEELVIARDAYGIVTGKSNK